MPEGNPIVGNLNMMDPKDRGIVRRQATDVINRRQRWPIAHELKAEVVSALQTALEMYRQAGDPKGMNDTARTLAVLEHMNMLDEHHKDKMDRLDKGQSTEIVTVVTIPPPVRARIE